MRKNVSIGLIIVFTLTSKLFSQELFQHPAFPGSSLLVKIDQSCINTATLKGNPTLYESNYSSTIESSFQRLVFAGTSTQSTWSLEIAFSTSEGVWSKWEKTEIHWHPGGRFWAKAMIIEQYRGGNARFRILNGEISKPYDIQFYSIEFIEPQQDEKGGSQPGIISGYTLRDTIPSPSIVTRLQWGAMPPNGVMVPHTPFRASIHHTAGGRAASLTQGISEMKFIQDLHINGNGWKDVGYHFCIDDSGRIYEGAEIQYASSHTDNNNRGNVGIAFLGSFSSVVPTSQALKSCADLLAYVETQYPVQTDSVFGHRDYVPSTECPGSSLYALLPSIRNSVRQLLGQDSPYIKNPLPLPFSTFAVPGSSIEFNVRDDKEGIDKKSLVLKVNNNVVAPIIQNIDPYEVKVTYTPSVPFEYSSLISVDVTVQDTASLPHIMRYHYQFRTKAQTIYNEMVTENSIANGSMNKSGIWTVVPGDVVMPDLSDGVMIQAVDSTGEHHLELYPNIKESGNYYISLAFPVQVNGLNAHYVVKNSYGISKSECIEYNRNYSSAWYQLGTSAVYFSAGLPSTGSIQLQPLSGFTTMMMMDAIKLEKQNPLLPPDIPELKSVRSTANGSIEIQWYPSLEGGLAGYRIMKSNDGIKWKDTIAIEKTLTAKDTLFLYTPPSGKGILYFAMVTVDTQKMEGLNGIPENILSAQSDVYGTTYGMGKKILIVDGFDRVGSWLEYQHPFIRNYGNALGTAFGAWETAVNDAIQTGDIDLEKYLLVIYMCGDDSDRDESLSNIEQLRLKKYVDNGGFLFITGSEIAYDLGRSGRSDIALFNALFKAAYGGDDSGVRSCVGISNGPLDGTVFTFGAVTQDTYLEDFPDYITPIGGSVPILYYQNTTRVAGTTYSGLFSNSSVKPGKLVYFSFPFETIYPAQSRAEVMSKIMNNVFGMTSVTAGVSLIPDEYSLSQNYPNPFNPTTTIEYHIPLEKGDKGLRPRRGGFVTLKVYDILGREVAVLVDEKKPAGRYSVTWDASHFASGVYLCRMKAENFTETRRLVLLR